MTNEEAMELLDKLHECIDKQISSQMEYGGYENEDGDIVYDTCTCPICETDYDISIEHYNYCPKCGQKLDWGDWVIK